MLCACINAQVGHDLAAQAVARQHALDRLGHDTLWVLAVQDHLLGALFDPAGVAGVPIEHFFALFAGHLDLLSIDNDDIVAAIHVRGESWLVLAAQAGGNDRCKTAQNNAFGVDDDPGLVDVCRCCRKSFRRNFPFGGEDKAKRAMPSCDGRVINMATPTSSGTNFNKYSDNNMLQNRYNNTPHSN